VEFRLGEDFIMPTESREAGDEGVGTRLTCDDQLCLGGVVLATGHLDLAHDHTKPNRAVTG
jgi:hypothetical protein